MTKASNTLLSEQLRPQQLSDLILPQQIIARLEHMLKAGDIMNMIFHGLPGHGKTSAARIITKHLEAHAEGFTYKFNGSSGTGAEDVRKINEYASSGSLIFGPTICFIDEADYLSQNAQAALRYVIENSLDRWRFLFTANDIDKISGPLQSRMQPVCFDIAPSDRSEITERLIKRYQETLPKLGVKYDEKRLREIVGLKFPDLRKIANAFDFAFGSGEESIAA